MKARPLVLLLCLALAAASVMAHGGEEHVLGIVTQLTDKSITVKTKAKEPVTVSVAATTKFIRGKVAAKIADLKVGDRVVIHAVGGANEKLVATTVDFASTVQSGPAAQQSKAQTLTGTLSDVACGATHTMQNMSAADCTRMCAKQGGYALVVGRDVYKLQGHEADLSKLAAETVTVTGTVDSKTVTVTSVASAKKG